MSVCRANRSGQLSANRRIYSKAFYAHVHELIRLGHERMNVGLYQDSEEPSITGELVNSIDTVLEDDQAPTWVIWYAVYDDPPINKDGRYGKYRQRVDIQFVKHRKGKRPKMQFEAKRLYDKSSASKYLGNEGLGCFLSGEYACAHQEAGMLGYVQVNNEATWADEIKSHIEKKPQDYCLCNNGSWTKTSITPKLEYTYRTSHNRAKAKEPIGISHIFLNFCNNSN